MILTLLIFRCALSLVIISFVISGLTVICVAHRLSNLARADRLLVLQEGRLVEEGTPAELQAQDGIFAEYARAHQAVLDGSS